MTKKGVVLTLILVVLLGAIIVTICMQNNLPIELAKAKEQKQDNNSDFDLIVMQNEGLNIEKLKSYGLPILIQLRFRK